MRAHRIIPAVGTGALLLALPLLLNACGDTGSASPELGATGIANAALAGTWEFNKALSDCPDSAPPPDSLRTPPGGMGWHGPGGPGDMMHHGGHGGPGMGGGLGMFACFADSAVQMTIAVTDTSVIFTHGDRSHALPTNGTAITHDGLGGEVAISVAWTDGALVETHTTPHGTMTVTYTVSADGNRLTITRTVDPAADHGPADATHVWDRVTE